MFVGSSADLPILLGVGWISNVAWIIREAAKAATVNRQHFVLCFFAVAMAQQPRLWILSSFSSSEHKWHRPRIR